VIDMSALTAQSKPTPGHEPAPVSEERTSAPADALSLIRSAMARAERVDWLTDEQRAECDQALEDLRQGRARLLSHEEMFEELEPPVRG
jgi:hypothetical protein